MININLNSSSHNFQKSNLVTQRGSAGSFDTYKCSHCGLTGKRYGLNETVTVKKDKKCLSAVSNAPSENLGKVIITRLSSPGFGLEPLSEHDRVPCPKEYEDKYKNDVWVYSPTRKEPFRLLDGEYKNM